MDRGHRRRGREPRSLDRGGAATEGIRQVNRQRGIAAESGEREGAGCECECERRD